METKKLITDDPPESRGHRIMRYAFWPILIIFIILMYTLINWWILGAPLILLPVVIGLSGISYLIMRRISIRDQVDGFKLEPITEE